MFYAVNAQAQLIHISNIKPGEDYFCPVCHAQLTIRKGQLKASHFAHVTDCHHLGNNESKQHQFGKALLVKWAAELGYHVEQEVYLDQIKRRADLMLTKGVNKLILEYQCAPIKASQLKARSLDYQRLHYHYFWVVGVNYRLKHRLTQKQAQFLRYHSHLGFYYLSLNVEQQRLELFYQIQQATFLPLRYRVKYLNSLKEFFDFVKNAHADFLAPINFKMKAHQLRRIQREAIQSKGMTKKLQLQCYLKQIIFQQRLIQLLEKRYTYPIYRYSKAYYQLALECEMSLNNFFYLMPFINYSHFI